MQHGHVDHSTVNGCDTSIAEQKVSVVIDDECSVDLPSEVNYCETERFRRWRKHTRDLYQCCAFVETIWPTRCCQFMPFMMEKDNVGVQYILCGTDTGDGSQNYVQILKLALPLSGGRLAEFGQVDPDTGEIGGFGQADPRAGVSVDCRIFHSESVITARFMPANPNLIATSSSNGFSYVFDWTQVARTKPPNDPPRPRAPYPPFELSDSFTAEQKTMFDQRWRRIRETQTLQDKWDSQFGVEERKVTMTGASDVTLSQDWTISGDGHVIGGSKGVVNDWAVAHLSREGSHPSIVPVRSYDITDANCEAEIVNEVRCSWSHPELGFVATDTGLYSFDLRCSAVERRTSQGRPLSLGTSVLDPYAIAVGLQDNGTVLFYDSRNYAEPHSFTEQLFEGSVQTLCYNPLRRHHVVAGGSDGTAVIWDEVAHKLLFRHAGHPEAVRDVGWSWQDSFAGQVISCDANAIEVWKPRDNFWE